MVGWFLRTWWVYVLLACILIITGLILPSNNDTYITTKIITITHYFPGTTATTGSDIAYLQTSDGALYYYNASDFTPFVSTLQSTRIVLTYSSQQTMGVDVQSTNSAVHLQGRAFQVVHFVSYDQYGQNPHTFTTNTYQQHPHGYYHIRVLSPASFLFASALLLFLISVVYLWIKKRHPRSSKQNILPAAHVASATTSIFTTPPGQPLPMPTLVIPVQPITDQFAAGQSMPGQLSAELAPSISSTSGAFHLLRPDVRDFPSYPSMPVEVPETPPVSSCLQRSEPVRHVARSSVVRAHNIKALHVCSIQGVLHIFKAWQLSFLVLYL